MIRMDDIVNIPFMEKEILLQEHIVYNKEIMELTDIIADMEMIMEVVNKTFYDRIAYLKTVFNAIDEELSKREEVAEAKTRSGDPT